MTFDIVKHLGHAVKYRGNFYNITGLTSSGKYIIFKKEKNKLLVKKINARYLELTESEK